MLKSLNLELVKEFYLLIKSYQMMVEPLKLQEYPNVSNLFRSMGGYLINENGQSYRFYKASTTNQIIEMHTNLTTIMTATLLGVKSGIKVDQIYDSKEFILPIDSQSVQDVDSCMVLHAWAALISANPNQELYAILARLPDQDYVLPTGDYSFPLCFPYYLSPDVFEEIVPKYLRHLNIEMVAMSARNVFKYPMLDRERVGR